MKAASLLIPALLFMVALSSCSNKSAESTTNSAAYTSAMQKMNARDYEGAIQTLEPLAQQQPQNSDVNKKLMHAYAGASGFEVIKFKDLLERLAKGKPKTELKKTFEEFKRIHGVRTLKDSDIRHFYAQRLSGGLVKALEDIPALSQRQYSRLNQAISMYEQRGFDVNTTSKDDNFQWGLLYSYRVLVNIRALCTEADHVAQDQEKRDNRELERRFIHSSKLIVADVLKAYKLFRHSYDKLQAVAGKVEDFAAQVSGNRLKARVLNVANSVEELFSGLLEDNRNEASDLVSRMLARARDNDFEGEIRRAFNEFENESAEVRFHKNRLRATTRIFMDEFRSDHVEEIAELKELFSDKLRSEIKSAFSESLSKDTFDPLNILYRDERSTFHKMADVAKALADDLDADKLRDELRPSVQALIDRVDREQLRMFQDDLKTLLGDEKDILDTEGLRHKEDLAMLKQQLGKRVTDLDNVIKEEVTNPAKPLVDEAKKPDPATEGKIKKQVEQTQDFLKR